MFSNGRWFLKDTVVALAYLFKFKYHAVVFLSDAVRVREFDFYNKSIDNFKDRGLFV